ncbi:MAG: hypothetical protein JXQ87_15575 [Bacteroidia bacterium]
MKNSFYITIYLIMISTTSVFSQITPKIIFPEVANESVLVDFSYYTKPHINQYGYEYLSVFVKNRTGKYDSNPIQGNFNVTGSYLSFSPYFPFESGLEYVVRTKTVDSESGFNYAEFRIEEKEKYNEASVLNVYPLAKALPENLLRFYFYFNTPMKKGEASKHIQLQDATGKIDSHAFMEFKQELWSADGKRLTLLFDPGRIKRGVSTNVELGPALLESNSYKLIVFGTWQDVYGQELATETIKEFTVAKAYREHIRVNELEISKPNANSYDTLKIHFDRIIDHALIHSMFRVEDWAENIITGHWEISSNEKSAHFIPEKQWNQGNYQIIIDANFEDVAGNNLNNLLDQKLGTGNNNVREVIRRITI